MDAAVLCLKQWLQARLKIGKRIRVSEVGFEYSSLDPHPDHFQDLDVSTSFVKNLIGK